MASEITVIIVTYNSENTIKECLRSVMNDSSKCEIIVADNHSQDKTREVVREFGGHITLIESMENLGFAKANNLAFSRVQTYFVVFLNPDSRLMGTDVLSKMKEAMINNSQFGLIGPKIVYPDGKIQKTVRNLPTIMGAFKEYILGIKGAYDFYQPKSEYLSEVESVVGACMMIKKDLFKELGGFDERFFLYFEDLQLCKEVRNKELKVGFLPQVCVEHVVGASGEGESTSLRAITSAKIYHGLINYFLIQLILTPRRVMNKLKK